MLYYVKVHQCIAVAAIGKWEQLMEILQGGGEGSRRKVGKQRKKGLVVTTHIARVAKIESKVQKKLCLGLRENNL